MAKKKTKEKNNNSDVLRLEALKERLKEIQDKWSAMTPEEQKIVSEAKKEINEINNKK
tara:strand:+ start:277 stop:450 length:174 start_codon:yes stop_codon:yes gene_type:complete